MYFKKYFLNISILFIFSLMPVYTIFAQEKDNNEIKQVSVEVVQKSILEKTPAFISKPILAIYDFLERKRIFFSVSSEKKQKEVKKEIEKLNPENNVIPLTEDPDAFVKIWKQIQYYILFVLLYIFTYKVIFYPVLFFIVFIILRSFYRLLTSD